MKRKAEIVLLSVSSLILVWMLLSLFDINAHNMTDKTYERWNCFFIFLQEKQQKDEEVSSYYTSYSVESDVIEAKVEKVSCEEIQKDGNKSTKEKKPSATGKDIMNLARIIQAENGGHKDDEALLLTGVVVLKRVKSKHYPDTIMGVISQKGQYSTYADGKFWNEPSKRSMRIAKKLLTTDKADEYPDNLVYQAEFAQGEAVYKKLGYEYFCLS